MLSGFAKLALVGTSFAPVLFTIAWVRWLDGRGWPDSVAHAVAGIGMVVLCLLLMQAARRRLEVIPFSPASIKTADTEMVGFVLAYLLPIIEIGGVAVRPAALWFVLGLLAVIVWTTNAYHVNPLLGLLGYHFYEVTTEAQVTFILITRRSLRTSGKVTRAVQLTEYMVLDIGKESQ